MDLEETEKLENLLGLGGNTVDTADADDKGKLGLGGDVEVAGSLGLALEADLVLLLGLVLGDVLLGTLEDLGLLGSLLGLGGLRSSLLLLSGLHMGLSLLEEGLWHGGLGSDLNFTAQE